MKRSLVIGRFQPFHKGHLSLILRCLEESDSVVIAIGSAQLSHLQDNPFTAGERYYMIDRALRAAGAEDYMIVPVEDLNRYSAWVSHVVSMAPPFDTVYSNNPTTVRLFEEAGFSCSSSPLYNRSEYSGTMVRRMMVDGGDWRSLVPEGVAEVIDEIDGVGRVKAISHDNRCSGSGL